MGKQVSDTFKNENGATVTIVARREDDVVTVKCSWGDELLLSLKETEHLKKVLRYLDLIPTGGN